MASFKVKVSSTTSLLKSRGLVKLGVLSKEYLTLTSRWSSLAVKIDVYVRMDLVEDMAVYLKRATRSKNFGMPFSLLFLS